MDVDSHLLFETYKKNLVNESMPYPVFAKLAKHASPKSSKEKDETDKDIHDLAKPSSKEHYKDEEEQRRLDPSCWSGYHKEGTKMKGNKRVNNCVKNEQEEGSDHQVIPNIVSNLLDISQKMWRDLDVDSFYSAKHLEVIKSHAESILRRVKDVAEQQSKVTSVSHNGYRQVLKSFK